MIRRIFVRIRILAHQNFEQTFANTTFLTEKLHLTLIYEIKVSKHIFLSIHNKFQYKKE
jgi:hypothetical protein